MTTKRDLIAAALGELGMAEYIFDATPEELQDALGRLNRLAAGWDGTGIRVGYNFGSNMEANRASRTPQKSAFPPTWPCASRRLRRAPSLETKSPPRTP